MYGNLKCIQCGQDKHIDIGWECLVAESDMFICPECIGRFELMMKQKAEIENLETKNEELIKYLNEVQKACDVIVRCANGLDKNTLE